MARAYTTEQLGPKQALTPEGYLLCSDVAIARTGSQLYASHELPTLQAGVDGLIKVVREEAEVFRPETMASFEGKSVTVYHNFVDPESWGELTKGVAQNVRRGIGDQYDLLMADLLITDAEAIKAVRAIDDAGQPIPGERPLREVSCGYDADYEQDAPGVAYQRNITGNHIALVPRGRAGPRCSIQDGEIEMSANTAPKDSLIVRLMRAIRSGDAALIKRTSDEAEAEMKKTEDEEEEAKKAKTEDSLAKLTATVDALATTVALLAKGKTRDGDPDDTDPEKEKTEDDADPDGEKVKTGDAMRDTVIRAEILAPGFSLPTLDSVADMASVTAVRRKVLVEALKNSDRAVLISPLLSGRTVDALSVETLDTVFVAASELVRQKNNAKGARSGVQTKDFGSAPPSLAEMNKRAAEFWKTN